MCYKSINLKNSNNQIEKLDKNILSGTSWKDPEYTRMIKGQLAKHQEFNKNM